jgi:hypothetical protein
MKVKIIILAFVSLLLACKKDEANSSSGEVTLQVTEYGSNAPVKNAFVGLLKRTSNGVGSSASWEVLKDGKTDSLGYINFGNYNELNNLYIDVQHPDYYDISTISYEQVKNQQSKIALNGIAYLGIKFIPDKIKPLYRAIRSYPYQINYTDTLTNYYPTVANELHKLSFSVFTDWINAGDPKFLLYDSTIYLKSPKLLDTAIYTIIY